MHRTIGIFTVNYGTSSSGKRAFCIRSYYLRNGIFNTGNIDFFFIETHPRTLRLVSYSICSLFQNVIVITAHWGNDISLWGNGRHLQIFLGCLNLCKAPFSCQHRPLNILYISIAFPIGLQILDIYRLHFLETADRLKSDFPEHLFGKRSKMNELKSHYG